jgi:hypothetical protein
MKQYGLLIQDAISDLAAEVAACQIARSFLEN